MPRSGIKMSRLYRFHYHRQREVIAAAQIQTAESPENLGRFTLATPSPLQTPC